MSKGRDTRLERNGSRASSPGRCGGYNSRSSLLMTPERARAIQAHADRTGTNQDFKARAMSAADRTVPDEEADE
jgi:hypothetical protein